MRFSNLPRYASYLTNGVDYLPIECGRFSCGITPPPGVMVSWLNGRWCINGKPALVEIAEEMD